MASVRDMFGGVLAKLGVHDLAVVSTRELAPRFRLFELYGETLKGTSCAAGDKLQLMVGQGARTYSPFAFDRERGTLSVLVFVHGDAPGSAWGRGARVDDKIRVFGPRGSIGFSGLAQPIVLFGDETSFGAARALLDAKPDGSSFVFETGEPDVATAVLAQVGIEGAQLVLRRADDTHLDEVEQRLADALLCTPRASLVLTGRAPAIQRLRTGLKARSLSANKSKAYWAPGKRGLD